MRTYPSSTIDFGELTHSVDDFFRTDETFSNMIGDPPTSGEMLKPDNCDGNCQSSEGGNGPSQMINQLLPNGGYYLSQNAEDIYSSFNILPDGEVPNSFFDFAGTDSPYLDTTRFLLTSGDLFDLDNIDFQSLMANQLLLDGGEMFNLNNSLFQPQMANQLPPNGGHEMFNLNNILFQPQMANQLPPNGDLPTLDTHQEGQNSNSSNQNEAQRRESIPFTIEEVEALVLGVQKHGRGSWKKIKDEAFGNDSRRTRTDLRDKWNNLVRTADIHAHRRRGAVPPEWLLEIVRRVENGMQIPPASHAAV